MNANMAPKPSKKNGRPRLLTVAEERELYSLYYLSGWTATQIRDRRFPDLKVNTIREIARRQRSDPKEEKPPLSRGPEKRPQEAESRLQQTDDTSPDAAGSGEN